MSLTGGRPYDGTTAAASGILSVANKIGTDDVSLASGSGALTGATVGPQAITSVGTLALGGGSAGNYSLTGAGGSVSITPAQLTVTNLFALDKGHDATTNATLNTTNAGLAGVVNGENVTLISSNAVGYFTDPNVGTNKPVTVTGMALDGDAATNNYSLAQPAGVTATISPVTVTILSGIGANSKVYDQTSAATITSNTVALDGVLPVDAGNVALSTNDYTASFASPNVGTGIPVTVGNLSLSGAAGGNDTVTPPAGLFADILPLVTPDLSGITRISGSAQLTFSGQSGQQYRVLATDSLTVPFSQWSVVSGDNVRLPSPSPFGRGPG